MVPIIYYKRSNVNQISPVNHLRYNSVKINTNLQKFIETNDLNPAKIYNDLHLEESRKNIIEFSKNIGAIYLIYNNITGDYYIGSASTNRLYSRFSRHLIYMLGSKVVKNAVRKYKLSNFTFVVLETFTDVINKENNKILIDKEDYYIKSLLPNYNILTEAGSSFGYKHTEISRIKMKSNYSEERRARIGNLNKGKLLSLKTKEKIREKLLGKEKPTLSPESILNMKKTSKSLILYNLDRTVYGTYSSITSAADDINCCAKTINRALKTEKKIVKRQYIVEIHKKKV